MRAATVATGTNLILSKAIPGGEERQTGTERQLVGARTVRQGQRQTDRKTDRQTPGDGVRETEFMKQPQ